MVNKNLYTLLTCLLLTGCDLIDYHPYDVRISGETDVNAHNIEQIEASVKEKQPSVLSLWEIHSDGMTRPKTL